MYAQLLTFGAAFLGSAVESVEALTGGILAMIVVAVVGVVVRKPLAMVPENTLKYAVGVVLTSIGTFWAAEGMGVAWPLDFVSIAVLLAVYFAASRAAIALIRR